jgi:homoserine dehydrogenase
MAKKVKVGIIGLGNIGSAVADTLRKNHQTILDNSGLDIKVQKVCEVRKVKSSLPLTRNANDIINDPEISVVVETIGGEQPALKFILAALQRGKHVVTPNKEVIAKHMKRILGTAQRNRVQIMFEGAVGGGITIISPLRNELSGNQISEIYGIVNGTTNYILSKMTEEGMEFADALKQAKQKGYAEPDPTADIEGYDAAYKAAILASVAFGVDVNWKDVSREGITKITQEDIQYARDRGYVIKLLAVAKKVDGKLDVRVHPALVFQSHPLASVSENFNAIYVQGKPIGELMFYGQGAGGGPTASAIIADIIEASKGGRKKSIKLRQARMHGTENIEGRYYIRLEAPDRFGVLAGISKAFAQKKVSISAVVQKETVGKVATIVILLHKVSEKNLKAALKVIKKLPVVKKVCNVIRIVS